MPGVQEVEIRDVDLRDEALALTRDLIRVDTSNPPGRETPAAVLLREYLEANGVPCELIARDPDRANLVARLRGTGDGPSLALLGHTDVVPADARDWTHPPFGAHVDDEGWLWGRGAVDMKNETATRAVTMAVLARSGFRPRGDLLFIAESDEEDGIDEVGLNWLVKERPDVRADYALNEGGGVRMELADGRVAIPINVGEKATLPVRVTALGEAGHASMPAMNRNAVPLVAELVGRLARHRTPHVLIPEVRAMLETLAGPFADDEIDDALARATALLPTFSYTLPPRLGITIAPTRLGASDALNVMPGRASVDCDCRLLPGMGHAELEAELRAALGDDIPYELEWLDELTGGTISPVDTPLTAACQGFFDRHDPGAVLLPEISTGFTDSHYMREAFGTAAYGIWPIRATPTEVYEHGFHNADERLHVDDLAYAVRFHLEVAREIGALGR